MAFDGNGNWIPEFSAKEDRDAGIKILANRFDDVFQQDLKESFEKCITIDGQNKITGDFNFNNFKGINLADPVLDNDAVNKKTLTNELNLKVNVDGSNITEETATAIIDKINDENKQKVVSWGVPDYSAAVSIGNNVQTTMNQNGFAYYSSRYTDETPAVEISIDNEVILKNRGDSAVFQFSGTVFIPKDTPFKMFCNRGFELCLFIPLVGG